MAEQTAIELTDDLVGSTATQSVELGFRGTSCTIDLDDDNASDVDDAVAPCIAAAEASGGAQPSRSGAGPAHDPGQTGGCPDVVGAVGPTLHVRTRSGVTRTRLERLLVIMGCLSASTVAPFGGCGSRWTSLPSL